MTVLEFRVEALDVFNDKMATGQPAFSTGNPAIVFDAILNRGPVSILSFKPDLPLELETIVEPALAQPREVRHQSAWDIRNDLKRLKWQLNLGRLRLVRASPAPMIYVTGGLAIHKSQ